MLYVFFMGTACLGRTLSIEFNNKDFHVDSVLKIIVCSQKSYGEQLSLYDSVYAVFGHKMLFKTPPKSLQSVTSYILIDTVGREYELFFTQLPLVSIISDSGIVDQQVPAYIEIHDTSTLRISSHIGMELRGGSSRAWPKKKFEIQFWLDSLGKYIWEPPLFKMRGDKDWIFEAMYNEPMRIRSFTNWQIWRKTHVLHYANIEKDAKPYVTGVYVELFLNGRYHGVYAVTEKMDRKQLRLKKPATAEIEGELYKAYDWGEANQYFSSPNYDNGYGTWGGYEIKYPNELSMINWEKIHEFTEFVVNSSDAEFEQQIAQRFHIPNAIDYYLFLNLLTAYDNAAKNLFTAKYDKNTPYFYVPWDLDGTWGVFWDGVSHNYTDIVMGNRFYDRLLKIPGLNFKTQLEERWAILRQGPWDKAALEAMFLANRNTLLHNNVYRREQLAWPEFTFNDGEFLFLQNFLQNRIRFLDAHFHYQDVVVTAVSDRYESSAISISPNPASSEFRLCQDGTSGTEISIVEMSGKIVQTAYLHGSCSTIDISTLKAGVYIVKSGHGVHKLVVQKTL